MYIPPINIENHFHLCIYEYIDNDSQYQQSFKSKTEKTFIPASPYKCLLHKYIQMRGFIFSHSGIYTNNELFKKRDLLN